MKDDVLQAVIAGAKANGSWYARYGESDMKFKLGDTVKKVSGSQWHGKIVGLYSTELVVSPSRLMYF